MAKKRVRGVDEEIFDELLRTVATLRRRVASAERKVVALEKKMSVPVDVGAKTKPTGLVLTPDGLVMIRGVPHLVECTLVRQPLFRDHTCTCGSLGTREQRRS